MATIRKPEITQPIGRRRVKNHLSEVFRETVEKGKAAPLSNNGTVDAYLVPVSTMDEIAKADRLREALPLLMAAAAAGAAIPSRTLMDLGIEIPFDWQKLNRFTAAAGVKFTAGEDGEPWVAISDFVPEAVKESEFELDL